MLEFNCRQQKVLSLDETVASGKTCGLLSDHAVFFILIEITERGGGGELTVRWGGQERSHFREVHGRA